MIFIYAIMSYILDTNLDSFVVFRNYDKIISINNNSIRESKCIDKCLYGLNLDPGRYNISSPYWKKYNSAAYCLHDGFSDQLYKNGNPIKLKEIKSDFLGITQNSNKNFVISLSYNIKCLDTSPIFLRLRVDDKTVYQTNKNHISYFGIHYLTEIRNGFYLDLIKTSKKQICGHLPTSNIGYDYGFHFCILELNNGKTNNEIHEESNISVYILISTIIIKMIDLCGKSRFNYIFRNPI